MATEIDLVRKKQPSLRNTSFLNKGKLKFLQIKQATTRQKCHQKREFVRTIRCDTPCTQLCAFWMTPNPTANSCVRT